MKTTQLLLIASLAACGNSHPYNYRGVHYIAKSDFQGADAKILQDLQFRRNCQWFYSAGEVPVDASIDTSLEGTDVLGQTSVEKGNPERGGNMRLLPYERVEELESKGLDTASAVYLELRWRLVFLHELGHALGLMHTTVGLMAPAIDVNALTYEQGEDELIMLLEENETMPQCAAQE